MTKKTKVKVDLTRRDVLTVAAAAVGSAIVAPFVTTGPLSPFGALKQGQLTGSTESGHPSQARTHHWIMVIDLDKCIGCEYCLRSCCAVNDVAEDKPWNIVVEERTTAGTTFY